jgi:hypothetical protein
MFAIEKPVLTPPAMTPGLHLSRSTVRHPQQGRKRNTTIPILLNLLVGGGSMAAQGVVLVSDVRKAGAANYKAKADLLQARLGYLLAYAELERTVSRAAGAP